MAIGPGMSTEFEIRIDGQGLITTAYTLHDPVKAANEVGVSYILSSSIDQLSWDRKALWSAYPNDHIGRPIGIARRQSTFRAANLPPATRGSVVRRHQGFLPLRA